MGRWSRTRLSDAGAGPALSGLSIAVALIGVSGVGAVATGLGLLVIIGVWVVYNLVRPPGPRLVLRNGAEAAA